MIREILLNGVYSVCVGLSAALIIIFLVPDAPRWSASVAGLIVVMTARRTR